MEQLPMYFAMAMFGVGFFALIALVVTVRLTPGTPTPRPADAEPDYEDGL